MSKEIISQQDIEKIEKIIRDRKISHTYLINNCKRVYGKFVELEEESFAKGSLDKYTKELIALGISIIQNCESCMEWHISQALTNGATKEQILETVGVAIEMGGGPATVASRFAVKVLEYHLQTIK
ncbi:MAG TPA: carboxymuconolactone decarboxylase family protein [Candidatus Bathyarchaeia archaeon]|nr:carboxymuconolactone decarboxylase family protein [Candidatus Bathyarchaeia archaeon]